MIKSEVLIIAKERQLRTQQPQVIVENSPGDWVYLDEKFYDENLKNDPLWKDYPMEKV